MTRSVPGSGSEPVAGGSGSVPPVLRPEPVVVVGMDAVGRPLSPSAVAALAGARLVVGAARHLAAVPVPSGVDTVVLGPLAPALDRLAAAHAAGQPAVVLASGDPGFFGVVRRLRAAGLPVRVLPAVSSVAAAFARAGLDWDGAVVVTAHGRELGPALNACRALPAVAVLTAPGAGAAEIGAGLTGWARCLVVAEHLGTPAERVTWTTPEQAVTRAWADPHVLLSLAAPAGAADGDPGAQPAVPTGAADRDGAVGPGDAGRSGDAGPVGDGGLAGDGAPAGDGGPAGVGPVRADNQPAAAPVGGWALPESAYRHRDSMITKAEVRALAVARLRPRLGRLVWDVGAGSGSVGIECALLGAAVIAVERDPAAPVAENAARHGVAVRVVTGDAPAVLGGLPDPDAVFVGGGGPTC
ncbi:precorrin-6y C5,15-methyltransferase (decarboxylating) subunit CbiE [Micromonospora matsumotoense]|uniref:precorrin-6y C5,15-methyltransferase (decarboxylating) subunit CbiE n=1 Tax=Micromonospora matsumotoense TaxID=121616 RepID=UPI003D8D053A